MAPLSETPSASRTDRRYLILCAWIAAIGALLAAYGQTRAFAYDEGFHLLSAQLIAHGKLPYLDFFFPQAPWNAFWNAAWMSVFGESWRVTHAASAILTTAAVWLTADFVYVRADDQWRLTTAVTAAIAAGLNPLVLDFGTIAQAYGMCLFLAVASFRVSVVAVERRGLLLMTLAGFLSAAAACSSLLAAPVAPVLAIWTLWQNRAGNRLVKFIAFLAGALVAAAPLIWLYLQGPRRVWFNLVDYHLHYREVHWSGAWQQNLEVITSWMLSPAALTLGILAAAGVQFVCYRSGWPRGKRAELYLCLWLIAALALHLSRAAPTFERYYLLCVPFLAILAAFGLYSIASRLSRPSSQWRLAGVVVAVLTLSLARRLYDERTDTAWPDYEAIAKKVEEVTPPGAKLLAEEQIYFLTRRVPPSGMEHHDAHKLETPIPGLSFAQLHILPQSQLDAMTRGGIFDTVEVCKDDGRIDELGLANLYRQRADISDCSIFWERAPK
ncbi:MAG: hypothetical protein ABI823_09150 [Bryobacteraceae bacterium]